MKIVCADLVLPKLSKLRSAVVDALGLDVDVASLHRLRIAVKHLRYAVALLVPVCERPQMSELVQSLASLQKQLGKMQDHVVAKRELERSVTRLRKKSHQKILKHLIETETRSIADSVRTFRSWRNSSECQGLKQCIESIAEWS